MYRDIVDHFLSFIPCEWEPNKPQIEALKPLCAFSEKNGYHHSIYYRSSFIEAVNQKLANNQTAYQHILNVAFKNGIKLNYLQKARVRSLLDCGDLEKYSSFLIDNGIYTVEMQEAFQPISMEQTETLLKNVVDCDKKYCDVLCSIFSRYCFNLFDRRCTSTFFSGMEIYSDDYTTFIEAVYPGICNRDNAFTFLDISKKLFISGYDIGCNSIVNSIKESFHALNNHCDMAVYVPDIIIDGHSIQWELFSDIVLYSEKMNPETIDKAYFRWKRIKEDTERYIPQLTQREVHFDVAFQGFVFKDCLIIKEEYGYSLLLVFEKNERDERPLYCPACRSVQIEGNSYPILNVRSWECKNPLCPDRSRYNRGKRYDFSSITRQKLMSDEANLIPEQSIAYWHLDCVEHKDKLDIFEMAIRHYSCNNDGIYIFTCSEDDFKEGIYLGRFVHISTFKKSAESLLLDFKNNDYFKRYICTDTRSAGDGEKWEYRKAIVYNADSFRLLKTLSAESIDGAVTSPPYYNAKEYSQWENIYCYLYDMYNISVELFRILKPGSVYLFNIFDYFDNERNIVFSAMGKKRMILSAYMLDIFKRIGFSIQGNIVWFKGEIQGNRSFNQGNLSPYYQAPLNCWEHIFILSKASPAEKYCSLLSRIERIRPVVKMMHGENVLGHDAPYPLEIPGLLLDCMDREDVILDPFLGSGTTCIAAERRGIASIGIEKSNKYFELCKRLIPKRSMEQLSFDYIIE